MRLSDAETQGHGFGGGGIAGGGGGRLAEWLEMTLGTRLTAFASGLTTRELVRIAHGDEQPGREAEQRLRNLFAVAALPGARDGAGSAYAWPPERNEDLEGRSPASLLHDGGTPESVWF